MGSPSVSPRQTARKPPWAEPRTKTGSGVQKKKWGAGKECHTSTASCKEEPGPLECATTVTLAVTSRASSPPPPRAAGGSVGEQPPAGLFLHRSRQEPSHRQGLHHMTPCRKGTEQHPPSPRAPCPKGVPTRLGQHLGCRPASGICLLDLLVRIPPEGMGTNCCWILQLEQNWGQKHL